MSDGPRSSHISRKIKQGNIDVDYEESSLVVNFTLEVVSLDSNERILDVLDSKPDSRRIKIKSIASDRNLAEMAAEIAQKCKYIHPSRVEEVEQLLIQLNKSNKQKEKDVSSSGGGGSPHQVDRDKEKDMEKEGDRDRERERERKKAKKKKQRAEEDKDKFPSASMEELDDYLELLYQVSGKSDSDNDEGLKAQVRGTAMILKLCRSVANLEVLIQNSTVMGALTRVLQEEFKKSVELTFNILRIFLAFSNFMEMHGLMANYRIGMLTMKAIDFEFKRSELRLQERHQLQDQQSSDLVQVREQDPSRVLKTQEKHRQAVERLDSKTSKLQKKQEKIFFVGFYVLLNLAEDVSVERKMVKKGLIENLLLAAERNSSDLLVLAVTFLKKLSVFEENKNIFKAKNILHILARFIPCSSQPLMNITLRLIFNLSFDVEIRDHAVQLGMIPKLVALLKVPSFRGRALKLLYHLSVEDRCKSMFTYTDGMPLLMGMIVNFPQNNLAKELAGLAVNLSLNPRNAEIMASNRGLNHLMDRMMTTQDPLLMKLIRNIAQWSFQTQQELENADLQYKHRGLWSPHIKNLCRLAVDATNHDLLVEVLGTLACLTTLDIPVNHGWGKLLSDYHLLSLISKLLVPGMAQNDVLLEVIMLISAAASDNATCSLLASSNIIGLLYQVWKDKSSDVEILLQLMFCFYKFFQQESSQEEAMYGTRVVVDIMDCLTHGSCAVRDMADTVVEMVLEVDRQEQCGGQLGQLGEQIRKKRFESYNQKWLAAMKEEDQQLGHGDMGGSDYYGEHMVQRHRSHHDDDDDDDDGDEEYLIRNGQGHEYGGREGEVDVARMLADEQDEDMQWNSMMEQRKMMGMGGEDPDYGMGGYR